MRMSDETSDVYEGAAALMEALTATINARGPTDLQIMSALMMMLGQLLINISDSKFRAQIRATIEQSLPSILDTGMATAAEVSHWAARERAKGRPESEISFGTYIRETLRH